MDQWSGQMDGEDMPDLPEDDGEAMTHASPEARMILAASRLDRWSKSVNILLEPDIDKSALDGLGSRVVEGYQIDVDSRAEWLERSSKAMDLAMQVAKTKSYPWQNASNVIFPLMTTAAVQFAARAYPAIVPGRAIVKGVVVAPDGQPQPAAPNAPAVPGAPSEASEAPQQSRADRIGEHMSWQLLDEMPEWEDDTDTLLHVLPIVGSVFRKSYFDPTLKRNMSVMVPARKLVINYWAKTVDSAPRLTEEIEYYPREIEEMIRSGIFADLSYYSDPTSDHADVRDDEAPVAFLEQHRYIDLDGDGYSEPYIVTVHKQSNEVARIVARFDADRVVFNHRTTEIVRIPAVNYYTQYVFLPNPDGGIYGVGFGQLLGPINEGVNTTLNMMFDAGHLANTSGGFVGSGLSMNAGSVRFQMGEYKSVNVKGSILKDEIVPVTFPGPNPVLFQLLGMLIEAGREVASVQEVLTGQEPNANTPATTTLAVIEQGLKVFTAIYKRIWRAFRDELKKLYRLNRIYLNDQAQYQVGVETKLIQRDDYAADGNVEPVADPSMVSDMQRLGRAGLLMQFANDPMFNGREIRRRVLDAAGIDNLDQLLLPQPPPNPMIVREAAKLELEAKRIEAETILKESQTLEARTRAILNIAQADKLVSDVNTSAIETHIKLMLADIDQMAKQGGQDAGQQQAAPKNQPDAGAVRPMASPPGQPSGPALPQGLPGQPPIQGAAGMAQRV